MPQVVNITRDQLTRALRIYWKHAWPPDSGVCPVVPDWSDLTLRGILATFVDESEQTKHTCRRYVQRLGNYLYPHMKFAIEQCVHKGDYYFIVDCHDDALAPATADLEAWKELRSRNYAIKLAIEAAFERAGLPTFAVTSRRATGAFQRPASIGKRILVVDDEPANAALTGAMLRAEGFGTDSVLSGTEAIRAANRQKPDLIVSDYEMPGMTGREVAERIKSNEDTREIPVLICTYAEVSEDDLRPADALLRRPFSQQDLKKTVARLLARSVKD